MLDGSSVVIVCLFIMVRMILVFVVVEMWW